MHFKSIDRMSTWIMSCMVSVRKVQVYHVVRSTFAFVCVCVHVYVSALDAALNDRIKTWQPYREHWCRDVWWITIKINKYTFIVCNRIIKTHRRWMSPGTQLVYASLSLSLLSSSWLYSHYLFLTQCFSIRLPSILYISQCASP